MKKQKKEIVSRDQALELLFEYVNVNDWDHETMVMYIEEHLQDVYQKLSDKELTKELAQEWENKHATSDEDECPFIVDESPTAQVLHGD